MITRMLEKLLNNDEKPQPGAPRNVTHSVDRIADALREYEQKNQLLTAVIMDSKNRKLAKLTTGIIEVDHKAKEFIADEFIPSEANTLLGAGVVVQFSLSHQGARHQFSATWQRANTAESGLQHWFCFPSGIEQIQLRNAFRVHISQAHPVRVSLTQSEKPTITGHLADLSASGMRVRCEGNLKPKLERGADFTSCHFVLQDGNPIVCGGRLIHWSFEREDNATYLGIEFLKLNGNTQRILNRFLTGLQRKQRQIG